MIRGRLSELAGVVGGALAGDDRSFEGASTDTRTLAPGQLFFALQGPRFDAHEFVSAAASAGAAGAVVSRPAGSSLPEIRVADTLVALGAAAAWWRGRFGLPVIAVTGSAGKTTVKEMLGAIMGRVRPVLVTRGNLNNEIGLPLTLFRLDAEHASAVLEMGANHAGEIARMARIAGPDVGLVTLAGPAHLEGFGSMEGVARAKGELYQALEPGGTAVINRDDPYAEQWRRSTRAGRVVTFGLGAGADFTARELADTDRAGTRFLLDGPWGETEIRLPLPGRHNVLNALAAAAAAWSAGATPVQIERGLGAARGVPGRMQLRPLPGGARLVDDTYNANPGSTRAALDYLASLGGRGWAVLGDMMELGPDAARLHAEVGAHARAVGVERLYGFGPLSRETVRAFGDNGRAFDDIGHLIEALAADLRPGINVLVKASRGMRLERVVEALVTDRPVAREG